MGRGLATRCPDSQLTEWETDKETEDGDRKQEMKKLSDREKHIKEERTPRKDTLHEVPLKTHQLLQKSGDMRIHCETLHLVKMACRLGEKQCQQTAWKQHVIFV